MNIAEQPFYFRATIKLILAALIIAILILAKDILIPLIIAIFFTFLLLPAIHKLEAWHFPKAIAILVSIILATAVVAALIYFFIAQVLNFVNDWPALQTSLINKWEGFQKFITDTFNVSPIEQKAWITSKIKENASTGGVLILGIFSATTSFLASFALIPIYIFFLSLYENKIKEFVRLITREDKNSKTFEVVEKVSKVSQKYLVGIFSDVVILSIINSTGFLILGLPHAILFGVLASMLNIIPYIGVLIGSLLPITMAFLTKDAWTYTLAVAGICVVTQFIDNNFITPNVVGSSVSINPLAATIVLVASSLIWGIPGMILCLPLTGMAKVVFDNIDSLKPYGYLLGEEVKFDEQKKSREKFVNRIMQKKKESSANSTKM